MNFQQGDPARFWSRVEKMLLTWEKHWSPVRWRPWRSIFLGREGLYVLLRCGILAGLLAATSLTSWHPLLGAFFRVAAISIAILLLSDILIVHASIVFVSRKPVHPLRSAVLAVFSFFQIPLAFSVFYLCCFECFNVSLTWHRALYFSVVTATTLGYGDIFPKQDSTLAQILVVLELLISLTFLSILVARLIALITSHGELGPGGLKADLKRGTDAEKTNPPADIAH